MKGISPLVASVLLIAFTVAIATIIMGWMGTFTRETTATISNRTTEAVDCASASVSIDDVYIGERTVDGNASVRAIVRNTGFTDNLVLKAASIYKNDGTVWNKTDVDSDFDKGEITTITFTITKGYVACANFSKVVVTTQCGGVGDTFDGTPKC
jgi:flagellin-like protein